MSIPAPAEPGRPRRRARTRRPGTARLWLPLVLVAGSVAVAAAPAQALPLTITVVINSVVEPELANIDSTSDADFYGRTFIEGQETRFDVIDNDSFIDPDWTATGTVDHTAQTSPGSPSRSSTRTTSPTSSTTRSTSTPASTSTTTHARSISPSTSTFPTPTARSPGTSSARATSGSGRSETTDLTTREIWFTITVTEPAQAPGLHVGCIHSPLWPQPGDAVTFTATSFGDQPDGQALPAKLADTIEIWYSTNGGVTRTVAASAAQTKHVQHHPERRRQRHDAVVRVPAGRRRIARATPAGAASRSAIPLRGRRYRFSLSAADRERAIDFVLFPVTSNVRRAPLNPADTNLLTFPVYTGPTDGNFLTQAGVSVAELMREQVVLDNQRA